MAISVSRLLVSAVEQPLEAFLIEVMIGGEGCGEATLAHEQKN
jgi:hypothetical protein